MGLGLGRGMRTGGWIRLRVGACGRNRWTISKVLAVQLWGAQAGVSGLAGDGRLVARCESRIQSRCTIWMVSCIALYYEHLIWFDFPPPLIPCLRNLLGKMIAIKSWMMTTAYTMTSGEEPSTNLDHSHGDEEVMTSGMLTRLSQDERAQGGNV